jgi:hypothetical protein
MNIEKTLSEYSSPYGTKQGEVCEAAEEHN